MIEVINLEKSYGHKPALIDVNLTINPGDIYVLVGPNGAGKTTTLKCIYGDLKPDEGKILVFEKKLNKFKKRNIAVLLEERVTFKGLFPYDYAELWKILYPNWNEKKYKELIMEFNLPINKPVHTYSSGMKTLFHIILMFSSQPKVLILDEPTQNIDPVKKDKILKMLKDFTSNGENIVIMSTHHIEEVELIATRFAIINSGKTTFEGNIEKALSEHKIVKQSEMTEEMEIITQLDDGILVKTSEKIGRNPDFREVVLGYLKK
ncbi:ABC-2 type transport system ATP-binding protein [Marinitoga hydrogenitolerans DSM 16785]|uniref:ABC-2 type transport system ATP-binding protein n=1 Tax=Marinitoga hydrogenitolerans (strain DSM 16785 / JCM 12826 / AT1271) TaxID=1122195 RepID=A0A1M4WHT9_MARH1|nr:ABC transporter ATP-binding protein [Marinitoga hydrogenitolerans]SHE80809.1 ABC-2 type transport system ATP-binding protein [Marinitoga hydrogenitolerans DSM 16785]